MSLKIASFVGALAPILVLAGCANTPAPPPAAQAASERACFRVSAIRGQRIVDRETVLFRTGVGQRDIYRVKMRNACMSTMEIDPLILIPAGGSDHVCSPLDLDVKVATPIGASPCMIESVSKLTPEEVAALPRDQRP